MSSHSLQPYPPVPFDGNKINSEKELSGFIKELKEIPLLIESATAHLSDLQLDKKTEKGVWTIRQVVHHIADSHMHAFMRFKFALTEESPVIKPYPESLWAELPDTLQSSVDHSLAILKGVHGRWTDTLSKLSLEDLQKTYYHPDDKAYVKLALQIPMYVWHGKYHLGFIVRAL